MLINVYTSFDNKYFIYTPFINKDKITLESYDIPDVVLKKFKNHRFIRTVNIAVKKLIQIKDLEEFKKVIQEQGFYLVSTDENTLENMIVNGLGIKQYPDEHQEIETFKSKINEFESKVETVE